MFLERQDRKIGADRQKSECFDERVVKLTVLYCRRVVAVRQSKPPFHSRLSFHSPKLLASLTVLPPKAPSGLAQQAPAPANCSSENP